MAHGSTKAIYTAAGANLAIGCAKFGAGALTGSTAMFAEGVHSVVDTANQILLLIGIRKSVRPADASHPFGHGRELYFYAFIVALFIFLGGGAFAVYEGIHKIQHPEPLGDIVISGTTIPGLWINLAVLGFAILAEGYSCYVALKQFWLEKGNVPAIRAIRNSKDPALFTILIEDVAAQIGLLIAVAGVILAEYLDMPVLDGWSSVAIGIVLIGMAAFLMVETHGLLIGEAADPDLVAAINRAVASESGVHHVNEVLTQHMGASDVLVNISLDFDDSAKAGEIERTVSRLEQRIKAEYPKVSRIFIEIQAKAASERAARTVPAGAV